MPLDYGMYDADNHLYEPRDAFTRHLRPERRQAVYWVTDRRGHEHIILNGQLWDYIPNPTFDPIAVAGSLYELYAGDRTGLIQSRADGLRHVEPLANRPEYRIRDARIARLDRQGIDAAIVFPTLVSGLEERVKDDAQLTFDLLWAFNRWLDEDWGFCYQDRIFATPVMSLADPIQSVELLDWALQRGAKAIMIRPAPVPTASGPKSPGDPEFDPFWARCQEAGTIVCAHLVDSGYSRYSGEWTGSFHRRGLSPTSFDAIYSHGRAITDFVTAMVCHGALTRQPRLRVASVENGGEWVAPLLHKFKLYYHRYPGTFPEDPVEAFERSVWVNPYWEEDAEDLARSMPVERILAGSDFPHADGLPEPTDFVKCLTAFSDQDVRRIMRDNLEGLLRTPPN